MIVALPAILAAILMVLTTREPERGATEDALKVSPAACSAILALNTLSLRSCRQPITSPANALHTPQNRGMLESWYYCTPLLLTQDLYAVEGFSYQEKISVRKLKLLASNFSTVFAVLQGLPGSLPWGVLLTFLNDFLSQHKGMSVAQATLVHARRLAILL